jgi:DNA repair exonuclease SbcCD ATPase subunit
MKLLVDAKSAIEDASQSDNCPVCETKVPGLEERLASTIERLRSDEFQFLQSVQETAGAALDRATSDLEVLRNLVYSESMVRVRIEEYRNTLRVTLGIDDSKTVHDLLAEAKKQLELIQAEIGSLEALASERDSSLEDHQADWQQLGLIEKWLAATEKAESSIDLSASPEWAELNNALDELAGFGSDLEFLGGLARDVQAERSNSRSVEINKTLGKYYGLITQDDTAIGVSVHITAQRISYDLVDASGRPAVPILNQAAINALSLAVLFAQSEAQANVDSWEMVVLDDPVQSLDSEKQTGLARAIEELSDRCSILVATVPGQLSDRLQSHVSKQRHIVTLGSWSRTDGASIENEVDR